MPLPKSLVQPFRQGQLSVGAGWRAYFAPFNLALAVNQTSTQYGPTIYDLLVTGKFIDGASGPPAGWFDLGLVSDARFAPDNKIGNVRTGYRGAVRAKYRADVGEQISCKFGEMSRMALSIAQGCQVFNLLRSTASASTTGPLSASGTPATPMGASGYQASGITATATAGLPTVFVPSGSGALFSANDMIVVDQDYNGSDYGFVGDAGANLFQGVTPGTDFIRMTSDYVATIKQVITGVAGQDALVLTAKFVGGGNNGTLGSTPNTAPTSGAKIQKINGYAARSGGTFIKEWSAVFLMDTVDASQIMMYYPRLAPNAFPGLEAANLENAQSLQRSDLSASFEAMAFDDPIDGETVVGYRAYFPNVGQTIQI